ncbi:MAG: TetR family transcriptional regulator, partial [Rhizobiales bacterium]|nr:TetR family transcriptional regulator [Hyphomicrobiales bacterium]
MPRLSRKDKIINAALALAEDTSWRDLKLSAIAKAAKLSLADVAEEFASKADILAAFMARTDAELLKKIEAEGEASELPRDRLFDVIMLRLELLEPHKAALRNITRDMRGNPQDLATT